MVSGRDGLARSGLVQGVIALGICGVWTAALMVGGRGWLVVLAAWCRALNGLPARLARGWRR
jgi:hypothetical protein